MYCTRCGKEALSTHRFCGACGNSLQNEEVIEDRNDVVSADVVESPRIEFDLTAYEDSSLKIKLRQARIEENDIDGRIITIDYDIENATSISINALYVVICLFSSRGVVAYIEDVRSFEVSEGESVSLESVLLPFDTSILECGDGVRVLITVKALRRFDAEVLNLDPASLNHSEGCFADPVNLCEDLQLAYGALLPTASAENENFELHLLLHNKSLRACYDVQSSISIVSETGIVKYEADDQCKSNPGEIKFVALPCRWDDLSDCHEMKANISVLAEHSRGAIDSRCILRCDGSMSDSRTSASDAKTIFGAKTVGEQHRVLATVTLLSASHIRDEIISSRKAKHREISNWGGEIDLFCDRDGRVMTDGRRGVDLSIAVAEGFFGIAGFCTEDNKSISVSSIFIGASASSDGQAELIDIMTRYLKMSESGMVELANIININTGSEFKDDFSEFADEVWDFEVGGGDSITLYSDTPKGSIFVEAYPPVELLVSYTVNGVIEFDMDEHLSGRDESQRFVGVWSPS